MEFRVGDEVCTLIGDEIIFGTIEYKAPSKQGVWRVGWINDPSIDHKVGRGGGGQDVLEEKLILTDRAIAKGSKVTKDGKEGICSQVLQKVDLRILGTNTVIPNVSLDEFKHMKEYTQKSVVHYQGWLGIVLSVQREGTVYCSNGYTDTTPLDSLLRSGTSRSPFRIESHFLYERNYEGPCTWRRPEAAPKPSYEEWKRKNTRAFIKDVAITSLSVEWIHQIDPSFPDVPKQVFKDGSYKSLQLIKELDDVVEVGNIGKHVIKRDEETSFLKWSDWQRKLGDWIPLEEGVVNKLQTASDYSKKKYWRVYDELSSILDLEDNKENKDKIQGSKQIVLPVEVVHVTTIPTIAWNDNTFTIPRSTDPELKIVGDALTDIQELPRPGDFVAVPKKGWDHKGNCYCVVIKVKEEDVLLRVLDTLVPGKIVQNQVTVDLKGIQKHAIFSHFNEKTAIIVLDEEGPDGNRIRIGNVIGTNLMGKINVRFVESNSQKHDEWIWPQQCGIYSVKGFDLECVKSNVVDTGDVEDQKELKLRRVIEVLEKKIDAVWKNASKTEKDLSTSLTEFIFVFNSFKALCDQQSWPLSHQEYNVLTDYMAKPIGVNEGERLVFLKGNEVLSHLVHSAVHELLEQAHGFLQTIQEQDKEHPRDGAGGGDVSDVEIEDATNSNPNLPPRGERPPPIFNNIVSVLDTHPRDHKYALVTEYKPDHARAFMRIWREELETLKRTLTTEMGILSRTFADRMDLMSFVIRGPEGTPYENGLYVFDSHLPPTYPNVPPQFHFNAFKAGRLNPNLYAEGRVCVSLLGTWTGTDERERWTKDSNMSQVLISIQGLILVKEPFHNEPGYEAERFKADSARAQCRTYNMELFPLIVKMMIAQIQAPKEPFVKEIEEFYKINVPMFLARVRRWLSTNESSLTPAEGPQFALFPLTPAFKDTMNLILDQLEIVWKSKLIDGLVSPAPDQNQGQGQGEGNGDGDIPSPSPDMDMEEMEPYDEQL